MLINLTSTCISLFQDWLLSTGSSIKRMLSSWLTCVLYTESVGYVFFFGHSVFLLSKYTEGRVASIKINTTYQSCSMTWLKQRLKLLGLHRRGAHLLFTPIGVVRQAILVCILPLCSCKYMPFSRYTICPLSREWTQNFKSSSWISWNVETPSDKIWVHY